MKNNIIVPIKSYLNTDIDKFIIYKEIKGKSGVYRWNNLITNKSYIGSAKSLRARFGTYYSITSVTKRLTKGSSAIYSAIVKYGYSNFSVDILEYCDATSLIKREQYYIDELKPEYNILKFANSRLGSKHSEKTKDLIRIACKGRKHSEEIRLKLKNLAKLRNNPPSFCQKHTSESILKMSIKKLVFIEILDIEFNIKKVFRGNKEAARYLNIGESTLGRYKKSNKLIKGKYLVYNL